MKTPKEVKEAWVAALRSGDFKQGRGALAVIDGGSASHCCLGVLCELYVKDGGELLVDNLEHHRRYNSQSHYPPPEVIEWAGLASVDGSFFGETGDTNALDCLNDNGVPFEDIADFIESHSEIFK